MQPSDTDPVLESDAFKMFCFKVLPCAKRFVHDWSGCPFAHHTEKARRRCPRAYEYAAVACPDIKQGAGCRRGERCGFAHNVFEQWLHPDRYRTQMCNSGALCNRKSCFFAHSPEQLRFPTTPNIQPIAFQAGYAAAATPLAWQMASPACIPPTAFQHDHTSFSVLNDDVLTAASSSSSPVSSLNFDPQEWADGNTQVGAGNMTLAGPAGMAPGHGQLHTAAAAMALQQLQQQQQQQLQQLDALAAMQQQQEAHAQQVLSQAQAKQQQRRRQGRQGQQQQQQHKPRSMMDMAEAQLHSHSLHLPMAGGLVSSAGADALRTSLAAAAAAKVARSAGARPASDSAIQHLDQLSQMLVQLQLATEQGQEDLSPKAAAAAAAAQMMAAGGPGGPGAFLPASRMVPGAGQAHAFPSGAAQHDALMQEAMLHQLQQAQIQRTTHQQRPGAKHMGLGAGEAATTGPMRPQGQAQMVGGNMAGMQGIHTGMLFDTTLLDRWCF